MKSNLRSFCNIFGILRNEPTVYPTTVHAITTVVLLLLACSCCLVSWNCATTSSYDYRAVTNGCDCTEYRTTAREDNVMYSFRGRYSMHKGIVTSIDIEFTNRSRDSLSLEVGSVRVSSRNVDYQYNNKFLPLPTLILPPGNSETVHLEGKSISTGEDWNRIAGESVTVTVRGLRLGEKTLPPTTVQFIPENPKLRREFPAP